MQKASKIAGNGGVALKNAYHEGATYRGEKIKPDEFIEISYITIKRMDNTPFTSMLFFADSRIIALIKWRT